MLGGAARPFPYSGQIGGMMDYSCVTDHGKIKDYLAGAAVVAFDFETSPMEAYRAEGKAALDAHKATITGVSFSVAEGAGIYVPCGIRGAEISKGRRRSWDTCRGRSLRMPR